MKRKVLLITTGGTIAGQVSQTKKENENIKSANQFAEDLAPATASIKSVHDIDVVIDLSLIHI